MKTLRRFEFKNQDYFITIVTNNREPILLNDIDLFWKSWRDYCLRAWVILPDHFHCLLNTGDEQISKIIHLFKIRYSRYYRDKYNSGKIWQNRYWDHIIRNQNDLNCHIDYIHYNPVKHYVIKNPHEYLHSSLSNFVQRDYYHGDWGVNEGIHLDGDFGE